MLLFIPQGHHNRTYAATEFFTQSLPCAIEVAVVFICLGHVNCARHITILQILPCLFSADRQTALCTADNNTCVSNTESFHYFTGKVEVTRSVQNIDFAALKFNRRHRQRDRNLSLDLFGIIITNSATVCYAPKTIGTSGQIQHTFHQGSFAGTAVPQQADVTDIFCSVSHCALSLYCELLVSTNLC